MGTVQQRDITVIYSTWKAGQAGGEYNKEQRNNNKHKISYQ